MAFLQKQMIKQTTKRRSLANCQKPIHLATTTLEVSQYSAFLGLLKHTHTFSLTYMVKSISIGNGYVIFTGEQVEVWSQGCPAAFAQ